MNEMRGVEKVRAARRWVNAIIGWERCAVIVLAVWFGVVFLIRDTMQLPHIVHSLIITDALDEITATGRASQQWPKRKERAVLANDLAYDLINGKLPEASDLQSMKRRTVEDPDHVVNTIPTRILLAAVDEMDSLEQSHSPRAGDPTFMENIAYGEKQGIDHSRLFFDALLPTFPAIGFVGTVSSLLIAMSKADKIVSTMEPAAKGIAAGEVTDILSLCFSTTFMALMCVLVFSPLSMAQRSREDQLIDQTEAAVHKNLRPHQS